MVREGPDAYSPFGNANSLLNRKANSKKSAAEHFDNL
jgi:hypothetical protein